MGSLTPLTSDAVFFNTETKGQSRGRSIIFDDLGVTLISLEQASEVRVFSRGTLLELEVMDSLFGVVLTSWALREQASLGGQLSKAATLGAVAQSSSVRSMKTTGASALSKGEKLRGVSVEN
jgi:hypothetical protein